MDRIAAENAALRAENERLTARLEQCRRVLIADDTTIKTLRAQLDAARRAAAPPRRLVSRETGEVLARDTKPRPAWMPAVELHYR